MVDLRRMNRLLAVDGHEVTVEAGITIRELGPLLAERGLALENQGDVDPQTLAGAICTATHGTGARFGNVSAQVVRLRLVTGRGEVVELREGDELLRRAGVARRARRDLVGDAALRAGVHDPPRRRAAAARRRARPLRRARGLERPLRAVRLPLHAHRADAQLGAHRPRAAAAERVAVVRARRPAGERRARGRLPHRPSLPRGDPGDQPARRGRDEPRRAPRREPPRLRQPAHRPLHRDGVRRSRASACRRRWSGCWRWSSGAASRSASRSSCAWWRRTTPCCRRRTAAPTGYIAVHQYRGMEFESYFRGVEAIMDEYGGRPHWGKRHYQSAATLRSRYPGVGSLPGGARPARPRAQVRERVPAPGARLSGWRSRAGAGRA